MIFHYEEITPQIRRPIVPVFLKSKSTFIFYHALIDSGADYCIFSLNIADLLEIKLLKRHEVNFRGVGKDKVYGYLEEITLKIGNVSYETHVIFADISDFGHGILGQIGFFDHFDVRLNYKNLRIEINNA